jgi:iron complex transport system substrate-binding protein
MIRPAINYRKRLCVALQMTALTCALTTGIATANAEGIVVRDARDREVTVDNPSRIVSIGGAIT